MVSIYAAAGSLNKIVSQRLYLTHPPLQTSLDIELLSALTANFNKRQALDKLSMGKL